jgi:BMFP domain-containing protein YqiC
MRSFADETAQELTSLRRKVRTLEHSLTQLEARLGEQAANDLPATTKRKTVKTV